MHKERFKSILLVFLIFSNIILGSKILIDKKLWPEGYNFFSNIGNLYHNIVGHFQDDEEEKTRALSPEKILINTGDQTTRVSVNSGDNLFFDLCSEAEKVLKSAFLVSSQNISQVKKDEIYTSLSSDSVLLEFANKYSTGLYAEFLGVSDSQIQSYIEEFSKIVISHSLGTSVYLINTNEDKYIRINISKNTQELVKLCNNAVNGTHHYQRPVINYSYDLKFDQPFGTQKTTINPFVPIYSTSDSYPVIVSKNPLDKENLPAYDQTLNSILKIFDINPKTTRSYEEAGGTRVFVENNSVLKIAPNGFLLYEATVPQIKLSESGLDYLNVSGAVDFVYNFNKAIDNNHHILLDSVNSDTLNFDFLVSGLKVKMESQNTTSGASVVVENGYLKKYSQMLRTYKTTGESTQSEEFFKALDDAIVLYSEFMNEIKIDKMYIGYKDDSIPGVKNASWIVNVDNVIAGN